MKPRAVFLDRDGVINACPGAAYYVRSWPDFRFLPGVPEALKALTAAGFKLFVLSNQSGIARGEIFRADLEDITRRMSTSLSAFGVRFDGVYYCVHDDPDNCECRKPKPGLFLDAAREHSIDMKASWNIGDSPRDIEAGNVAGVRGVLVLSGKTGAEEAAKLTVKTAAVKNDLKEAVEWILSQKK